MIGKTLSHYHILELLGKGSMDAIYRAEDTCLQHHVTIKILISVMVADNSRKLIFIKEAQTASALNHPGICTIHDIGESGKTNFIVMELIEGETLGVFPAERVRLFESELIAFTPTSCDALVVVPGKGVIRRDIIYCTKRYSVKRVCIYCLWCKMTWPHGSAGRTPAIGS